MRIKKANLDWRAMRINFNTDEVEWFNIFSVIGPLARNWDDKNKITWEQCIAYVIKKKRVTNREELKEQLRIWLMAMYWSRCEWEMIITEYPTHEDSKETKIDVWNQLEPNLDIITDYVINRMDIEFKNNK